MNNNEKIEVLQFYDFNDKNKIDSNNTEDNKNSKIKIILFFGIAGKRKFF